MKAELQSLRDGKINFDTFSRKTRSEWEKLATKLFRRYKLPAGVDVEDLMQEMMFHAWRASAKWDPGYGSDLTRYVTWTAYAEARRWVHCQRNAHRRSDHVQGRFPMAVSHMLAEDSDWTIDEMLQVEPTEDQTSAALRNFAHISVQLQDAAESIALDAWAAAGDVTAAAKLLMADPKLVSALNLWTEGAAQRLVGQAIATSLAIANVA